MGRGEGEEGTGRKERGEVEGRRGREKEEEEGEEGGGTDQGRTCVYIYM